MSGRLAQVPRRISDIVNAMNRLQHPRAAVRSAADGGGEVLAPAVLTEAVDRARRDRAAALPSSVSTSDYATAVPPDILVRAPLGGQGSAKAHDEKGAHGCKNKELTLSVQDPNGPSYSMAPLCRKLDCVTRQPIRNPSSEPPPGCSRKRGA
jgi:hypothetical protein